MLWKNKHHWWVQPWTDSVRIWLLNLEESYLLEYSTKYGDSSSEMYIFKSTFKPNWSCSKILRFRPSNRSCNTKGKSAIRGQISLPKFKRSYLAQYFMKKGDSFFWNLVLCLKCIVLKIIWFNSKDSIPKWLMNTDWSNSS